MIRFRRVCGRRVKRFRFLVITHYLYEVIYFVRVNKSHFIKEIKLFLKIIEIISIYKRN